MLKLESFEVCPIANTCEYRTEFLDSENLLCNGCNPDRDIVFVCDFYKPRDASISCISEGLKEVHGKK